MKKWGILPLFPTLLRHFSVLDRPRSDLLEAGKPIQDASAQDAAPLFLLFGIGNRRNVSKTDPKSRAAKSEVAEYRACGAEKRGFWANRQNREIATWGNATKNRPKNAAFIHAELDKRGISA